MDDDKKQIIAVIAVIILMIASIFYLLNSDWNVAISIYDQEVPIDSYIKVHCEIKPGLIYGDLENINVSWWIQPIHSQMEYKNNYTFIKKIYGGEIFRFEFGINIDDIPKGNYYVHVSVFSEGVKKSLKLSFNIYDPNDYI